MRDKLEDLRQRAIYVANERAMEASKITTSIRAEKINLLHLSAFMDVEKTTEALKPILELKKEASMRMLQCEDENSMIEISNAIVYADEMIISLLGIMKC